MPKNNFDKEKQQDPRYIALLTCVKMIDITVCFMQESLSAFYDVESPIILHLIRDLAKTTVFTDFLKEADQHPAVIDFPFIKPKVNVKDIEFACFGKEMVDVWQKDSNKAVIDMVRPRPDMVKRAHQLSNELNETSFFDDVAKVYQEKWLEITGEYLNKNSQLHYIDVILFIFKVYIGNKRRLAYLRDEFARPTEKTNWTLLSALAALRFSRELFVKHPAYAKQITKEAMLNDENLFKQINAYPIMHFFYRFGSEDNFTIEFFKANPRFLGYLNKQTFTMGTKRYEPGVIAYVNGEEVKFDRSIASQIIHENLSEILNERLLSFYDIEYISQPIVLLDLWKRSFFKQIPSQLTKLKHAALTQNLPESDEIFEELFIYPKNKHIREYFRECPALINELSPNIAAEVKRLHHSYFKKHHVIFPANQTSSLEKKAEKTKAAPTVTLSADETKLKNCLLLKNYTYSVDNTELKVDRFTLVFENQVYTIHLKLADEKTINSVINARQDNQRLQQLVDLRENRTKDDYWLEIIGTDVDNILEFINSVFDNDMLKLGQILVALGFKEANLNADPIEGFQLQAVNDNSAYQITFFYTTDIVNKIAAALKREHNGIQLIDRPQAGKGSREQYKLKAKKQNWFNFLKSQGHTFKIETAVALVSKPVPAPTAAKIELNQLAWCDSINRALYQLANLEIKIENGRVSIALPALNTFYQLQLHDASAENLFVPEKFITSFIANIKTLLPAKTKIESSEDNHLFTISFRTKQIEPQNNATVLSVHFANLRKSNENILALLHDSFEMAAWDKFLKASFSKVKGLKIKVRWDEQMYFEIDYPHYSPVWMIKHPHGSYKEVYVSAETQKEVLQRLRTNLRGLCSQIVEFSGGVKVYTHVAKIEKDPHAEICNALETAHQIRHDWIMGISNSKKSQQVSVSKYQFVDTELAKAKQKNKDSKHSRKNEADDAVDSIILNNCARTQPSATTDLDTLKQCIIQTINIMNLQQLAAWNVQGEQLSYTLNNAGTFGCLTARQVLQMAIDVINNDICCKFIREMKTIPSQLLLLKETEGELLITSAINLSEYLADFANDTAALANDFQRRYQEAVQAFINQRQQDCIIVPAPTVNRKESAKHDYLPVSHSFFISFFRALLKMTDMSKELLIAHAHKFLQFENDLETDKNHLFYEHIARGNLIRFLALLNYLTRHPQVELFRNFARHTLEGEVWEQFKVLTQTLLTMMQMFFTDVPKTNELSVPVFQQLFERHAAKIASTLHHFAQQSEQQQYQQKLKHRADHVALKDMVVALQRSDLNHEDIRDGIVGILSDIGESVTQGYIKYSQDKNFFQLCKDIFQNYGHYEFDVPYDDFIKAQYALYLKYQLQLLTSKAKHNLAQNTETPTPLSQNPTGFFKLNPQASTFVPGQRALPPVNPSAQTTKPKTSNHS